jgi:hypothetical protein
MTCRNKEGIYFVTPVVFQNCSRVESNYFCMHVFPFKHQILSSSFNLFCGQQVHPAVRREGKAKLS